MPNHITIDALPNMPLITDGDDVGQIIVDAACKSGLHFQDGDIICVASKAVSIAEGRIRFSAVNGDLISQKDASAPKHWRPRKRITRTAQRFAVKRDDLRRWRVAPRP